ncbi:MAG: AAA family ATPase [Pseudomonadales bacterium]|nr:AAA family ATPase [Pseudomonadales bacterium]
MSTFPCHFVEIEAIYAKSFAAGHRSIALCAANSGEGVSAVSQALALRIAQNGRKVLLVQANTFDMNYQQQMSALAQKKQAQMSGDDEASLQECTLEAESSAMPDSGAEKHELVPVTLALPGSNDLVTFLAAPTQEQALNVFREPDELRQLCEIWLTRYDAVIFDTTPLNQVNRNNIPGQYVAAACDACLLVVLAGVTSEIAISHAYKCLKNAGVYLTGVILNDMYNPSLSTELIRETFRFESMFPAKMAKIRDWVSGSSFLNAKI